MLVDIVWEISRDFISVRRIEEEKEGLSNRTWSTEPWREGHFSHEVSGSLYHLFSSRVAPFSLSQ